MIVNYHNLSSAPLAIPFEEWALAVIGTTLGAFYIVRTDTCFVDRAGTTPVSADGDPVGYVKDLSGQGHPLIAPSDAARPTYRTGGGKPYLEGDGVDDTMSTGDAFTVNAGRTLGGAWGIDTVGTVASSPKVFGLAFSTTFLVLSQRRTGGGGASSVSAGVRRGGAPLGVNIGSGLPYPSKTVSVTDLSMTTLSAESTWADGSLAFDASAISTALRGVSIMSPDGAIERFYGGFYLEKSLAPSQRAHLLTELKALAGITP